MTMSGNVIVSGSWLFQENAIFSWHVSENAFIKQGQIQQFHENYIISRKFVETFPPLPNRICNREHANRMLNGKDANCYVCKVELYLIRALILPSLSPTFDSKAPSNPFSFYLATSSQIQGLPTQGRPWIASFRPHWNSAGWVTCFPIVALFLAGLSSMTDTGGLLWRQSVPGFILSPISGCLLRVSKNPSQESYSSTTTS